MRKSSVSCLVSNQSLWFPPFVSLPYNLFSSIFLHNSFFYTCLSYMATLCLKCFLSFSSVSSQFYPGLRLCHLPPQESFFPFYSCGSCSIFSSVVLQSAMIRFLCMDLSTRLNFMTTGTMSYPPLYSLRERAGT